MNKRLAIVLMLAASASFPVKARSGEEPKPSEPFLKRTPSNAEWNVFFFRDRNKVQEMIAKPGGLDVEDGDAPENSTQPKSLTISKSGNIYREVVRRGNGQATEKWILNGLQIYELPQSGQLARSVLPSSQYSDTYSDYRRSDFEELEWIGKDNFQGVKDVGGRKVFEFRVDATKRRLTPREQSELANLDAPFAEGTAFPAAMPGFTAYLDTATQRPLYFDDGQVVKIYKFSERPPASLVIPPRFAAELETWKRELNRRGPLPRP